MKGDHGRGQILVITAVGLVVLMGIGALVVDLGFSWMLRRQEQNAADPAALAAARFIKDPVAGVQAIDMTSAEDAACRYAIENGIFDSTNIACDQALDPRGASLEVIYPPATGPYAGHSGYVQITISKQHPTFFGRLFGQSMATVSASAVAARERGTANTTSIYVKNPIGCPTMTVGGNSYIHIYPAPGVTDAGGFVHVESSCGQPYTSNDACSNGTGALKIDGTNANLYAPKVDLVGSCQTTQSDEPHGILDEAASPFGEPLRLQFPAIDPSTPGAYCGDTGPQTQPTGSYAKGCGNNPLTWAAVPCPAPDSSDNCVTLNPGVYYGGWKIGTHMRVTLNPGIYIIAGGGITITADGELSSLAGGALPAPVLIFNTDNPAKSGCPINNNAGCQQDLDITAGGALKLAGLLRDEACPPVSFDPDPSNPDDDGCPFGGIVIWYDQNGSQSAAHTGLISIAGGTELQLSGTIYAPEAVVNITGNSQTNTDEDVCPAGVDQVAAVQIIAWELEIGGTGDLCMPYDPSLLYHINLQGLVD